ncbi:hypothetical protein ACTT7V_003285 [Escherichia coli]
MMVKITIQDAGKMIEDARARLEKVVEGYRNDITRTNYKWKIKKIHCYPDEFYLFFGAMGVIGLLFAFLNSNISMYEKILTSLAVITSTFFYIYIVLTRLFKVFMEKKWEYDFVSEEDVLYLCGNPGLKVVISEAIKKDHQLTYTSLVERADMYIASMETKCYKEAQVELLEKIARL